DGAVDVADLALDHHGFAAVDGRARRGDEVLVERGGKAVILLAGVVQRHAFGQLDAVQQARQVNAFGLPVPDRLLHVDAVDATDHLLDGAEAHLGHDLAQFLGDEEEVVDDVLGLAGEARAQHRVLRCDADRTSVEVALPHHDAARGDQRRGGEAELVRTEQRADGDVTAGPEAAVDLHRNAAAQIVEQQRLLGLCEANFPRAAGVGERGQRRSARAAFVAGDSHVIGARLGNARRDRADADFGHQLDRDARRRVHVLQIVNQLRQILDRVDVVVRRRRDQADTRGRVPGGADRLVDLVAGKLAAFAGLRALGHLDLDVVGVDQVLCRDAEAPRGDLLDRRAHRVAVGERLEALRVFAAFAGVRLAADAVHRQRQRRVRLPRDRAVAHRPGGEALDDFRGRLDLFERYGLVGLLELHQAADRQQPFRLLVDRAGELFVVLEVVAAHRVLEVGNGLRRPRMILAAQAVLIDAADIEHRPVDGVVAVSG